MKGYAVVFHQVEAWRSAVAGTAAEMIVKSLQWTWSLSIKVIIPIAQLSEMSHQDCSSPATAGQVIAPFVMSHRSTEVRYAYDGRGLPPLKVPS